MLTFVFRGTLWAREATVSCRALTWTWRLCWGRMKSKTLTKSLYTVNGPISPMVPTVLKPASYHLTVPAQISFLWVQKKHEKNWSWAVYLSFFLLFLFCDSVLFVLLLQADEAHTLVEESRAEGNVDSHIYLKYFTAGCNTPVLVLIVLISVIAEVCIILLILNITAGNVI